MNKTTCAIAIVCLLIPLHSTLFGVTVLEGAVFEFDGPDSLLLDPSTVVIAVDVFGDQDRVVNGITFRTDGQTGGSGTATEGSVTVTSAAANQINDWAAVQTYTGADPASAANLALIMQDIRWEAAPRPLTVDINGLTPGATYNLQLLFNEGADRDRGWDIAVENQLVVDNMTSEGEGVWTPNNGFAYIGEFTLSGDDSELNIIMQQQFGGDPPMNADNNPILQAVILHEIVPEPSTVALVLLGWCGLARYLRRRNRV